MNLKYQLCAYLGSDEETSLSILNLEFQPRVMVVGGMEERQFGRNVL
jgi:hypothetical protein